MNNFLLQDPVGEKSDASDEDEHENDCDVDDVRRASWLGSEMMM